MFKWINYERACWILNSILFKKWYISVIASIIPTLIIPMYYVFGLRYDIYITFRCLSSLFAFAVAVSYILSMNIHLINIIADTFNFFFKVWNLFLWLISFVWIALNASRRLEDTIISAFVVCLTFLLLFLLDAMPLKHKLKRKIVIAFVLLYVPLAIWQYFYYNDIFYNPFESYNFQHTRISIKSVFLASYSNILLFIAKPVLREITLWFHTRLHCIHIHSTMTDSNFEPLVTPYKRCKVKWYTRRNNYILFQE